MTGHRFHAGCRRCTFLGAGHRPTLFRTDLERRVAVAAVWLGAVAVVLLAAYLDGLR